MTQTAESVWDRITGKHPEMLSLEERIEELSALAEDAEAAAQELLPKPSLSRNLELERLLEDALKDAVMDENPTVTTSNVLAALRANGLELVVVKG